MSQLLSLIRRGFVFSNLGHLCDMPSSHTSNCVGTCARRGEGATAREGSQILFKLVLLSEIMCLEIHSQFSGEVFILCFLQPFSGVLVCPLFWVFLYRLGLRKLKS